MGMFDYFSKEAREKRAKDSAVAEALRRKEKQQSSLATVRQEVVAGSSESLLKLVDDLQRATEAFTPAPTADDPEACRQAIDVRIFSAALNLTLAENRVLVRESTSDVYGLEYYPATDKASWPELATNCLNLLSEVRSFADQVSIATPQPIVTSMEERARKLVALSAEAALADGQPVPICIWFQHGGAGARFSAGWVGRAAILNKKVKPACQFKAIGDMQKALGDLPGSAYLFESGHAPMSAA
jgi:hypothetical protein